MKVVTRISCGLLFLLILKSCASYQLDNAQYELRNSFAYNTPEETTKLLDKFERKEIYTKKDAVLKYLERGTILHFSGDFKASFDALDKAEYRIEANYSKSIARGVSSMLLNDNSLAYAGEDYEDIYLNAFKTMNFIHLQDLEGALVEARRMSFKLDNMYDKYKGIAKSLSKSEHSENVDLTLNQADIQNSAFSNYLSTVLFTKTHKIDDARISYTKLERSLVDQSRVYKYKTPDYDFSAITDGASYNIILVAFAGRAPIKEQIDTRIHNEEMDFYLKISLPVLKMYDSKVNRVRVLKDGTLLTELPLIEKMDHVAASIYKVKEPIIYAKTYIRAMVKAITTSVIVKATEKDEEEDNSDDDEDEDFSILRSLFSGIIKIGAIAYNEASEKADLRSWQTMPGQVYSNVLKLPEGEHTLIFEYLSEYSSVIHQEEQLIVVNNENKLLISESLYWH